MTVLSWDELGHFKVFTNKIQPFPDARSDVRNRRTSVLRATVAFKAGHSKARKRKCGQFAGLAKPNSIPGTSFRRAAVTKAHFVEPRSWITLSFR
jgi:hypothetical protein